LGQGIDETRMLTHPLSARSLLTPRAVSATGFHRSGRLIGGVDGSRGPKATSRSRTACSR
jgi:hypothetical protein